MDQALQDLGDYVAAAVPRDVIRTEGVCGELIVVARTAAIADVLTFLRNDSNCSMA